MKEQSDHDLLICIDAKLKALKEQYKEFREHFENHLQHHFRYNLLAWTIALGAIVTLAVALIKLL